MANPELIERMAKLPVVLDIQPSFFLTDLHWIKDRVGEKRANMSYTWKTYQEAGTHDDRRFRLPCRDVLSMERNLFSGSEKRLGRLP